MHEIAQLVGRHGLALGWQVTGLLAVVCLVTVRLGERWAKLCYRLWLLVMIRLALPVVLTSPLGLLAVPRGTVLAEDTRHLETVARLDAAAPAVPAVVPISVPHAEIGHTGAAASSDAVAWFGWCWLASILLFGLASARRHLLLGRMLRRAPKADGPIATFVEQRRSALGLRTPVRCRVVPAGSGWRGPALVGVLRPEIVVPARWNVSWDAERHGPLLIHELMHLVRRDHWVNLLITWVRTVYCLHPLAWIASAQLVHARERMCDDAVIAHLDTARASYLRALCLHGLSLSGEGRDSAEVRPSLALARSKRDLMQRIQRLARPGHRPRRGQGWIALPLVALTLAATAEPGKAPSPELPIEWVATARDWHEPILALEQQLLASGVACDDFSSLAGPALDLIVRFPTMSIDEATFLTTLLAGADPDARAKEHSLWRRHLDTHPDDPAVLRNAAGAFEATDPAYARTLLARSIAIEPAFASVHWLGKIHLRAASTAEGSEKEQHIEAARRHLRVALRHAPNLPYRLRVLAQTVLVELESNAIDEAESRAHTLLADADGNAGHSTHGNAVHIGRLLLGEVALRRGDLRGAGRWLLAAAEVPASPQLKSFGPNTRLAEQLLRAGHDGPVLDYLAATTAFWHRSSDRLERWTNDIRAGRVPDFGSNRHYHL